MQVSRSDLFDSENAYDYKILWNYRLSCTQGALRRRTNLAVYEAYRSFAVFEYVFRRYFSTTFDLTFLYLFCLDNIRGAFILIRGSSKLDTTFSISA